MLSICTCVGGDPGDKYVDVGGDEMSATNFPSVYIEKDTEAVSIKCSSSSSSSSSSSDSKSSSCSIVPYYENAC